MTIYNTYEPEKSFYWELALNTHPFPSLNEFRDVLAENLLMGQYYRVEIKIPCSIDPTNRIYPSCIDRTYGINYATSAFNNPELNPINSLHYLIEAMATSDYFTHNGQPIKNFSLIFTFLHVEDPHFFIFPFKRYTVVDQE